MLAIVLYCIFGLGAAAFVAVVVRGVVNRLKGRHNEPWQDDEVHVHPGAGWGNGGSWH